MYYFDIMETFFENGIKYLVIGGLAVNLYGVPRVTQDIDLIISMDKENIFKTNRVLKKLGYVPRLPVNPDDMADENVLNEWIRDKNLKAFSFYHKIDVYKVVDILIVHSLDFADAFRRKTVKKVGNIEIFLVSIDDLIKMKQEIGRAQDLSDIDLLKKVKKWIE
ncbi:MAG: hypothetical protein ACTSRW_13595 [Candidatus Helarchaeota archaeon]